MPYRLLTVGTVGFAGAPPAKDWTILVYGGGVNNLDDSIRKNWEGADDQPLPENVDVFVRHFDKNGKAFDVHMSSDGTETLSHAASADDTSAPNTYATFLAEGMRKYPARRFLTVVSSHGKGAEGVIEDQRSQHLMTPQGFANALEVGRQSNNGKPIDAVLFDACRMASVEMAVQLMGSALVAVASMDNIASTGYSLAQVVQSASLSRDAYELGARLVQNRDAQQLNSIMTLAAVDLQKLAPLQKAIGHVSEELRALDPESAQRVRRISEVSRRNTISPDAWDLVDMLGDHILGSRTPDPAALEQYLDSTKPGDAVALVDFCQNLLSQEDLMVQRPALRNSLQAVLVAHENAVFSSRGSERDQAPGGLTVLLPLTSEDGPLYADGPERLRFEKGTGWSQAVHVVVPPGVPAQRHASWIEEELAQAR